MSLSFNEQLAFEAEGAQAALQGRGRADCPYNHATQPGPWNHWVYGHDIAVGERQTIDQGFVTFCSTAENAPTWDVPLKQAIDSGMWKPRFVNPSKKSE